MKINDEYDSSKLKLINETLRNLNVKFTISVSRRKYYIKLKDYVQKDFDKSKPICSDGEIRILAFAYFLAEVHLIDKPTTVVIDDPITSLDLSRKSVVAYKIKELFEKENLQVILLTHDISFVEKVNEFVKNSEDISLIEISNKDDFFRPLVLSDYLIDDITVYKNFIDRVVGTSTYTDKLIALISLRPYASLMKIDNYQLIEDRSSYFAHSIYSKGKIQGKSIGFSEENYNKEALIEYISIFNASCDLEVLADNILTDEFIFKGFDYVTIKGIYEDLSVQCIDDVRAKALFLRIMLEACLYQIVLKQKLSILHIGKEYDRAINESTGEKLKVARKLKELYDLTKKFHHGANEGSMLGLAYINPDELDLFDKQLADITSWIDGNLVIRA